MKLLFFISSLFMTVSTSNHFKKLHPVYMSVTEFVFDPVQKKAEMTCKIFSNDFESVLKKYHTGVDLLNPTKKEISGRWMNEYVQQKLKVKVNGKPLTLEYLGFEIEEDAVLIFYVSSAMESPKEIIFENKLLYDFKTAQMNIMHVEVNKQRKSRKLTYPDVIAKFEF